MLPARYAANQQTILTFAESDKGPQKSKTAGDIGARRFSKVAASHYYV